MRVTYELRPDDYQRSVQLDSYRWAGYRPVWKGQPRVFRARGYDLNRHGPATVFQGLGLLIASKLAWRTIVDGLVAR